MCVAVRVDQYVYSSRRQNRKVRKVFYAAINQVDDKREKFIKNGEKVNNIQDLRDNKKEKKMLKIFQK